MGFNSRLDDLHAGVLSAKLKHIDEWNDLRRQWAARYYGGPGIGDASRSRCPSRRRDTGTSSPVRHRDQGSRNIAMRCSTSSSNGVDAKCHYPIAIHQQEGYPWGKEARIAGPIPNSEKNAASCISLPMFPN